MRSLSRRQFLYRSAASLAAVGAGGGGLALAGSKPKKDGLPKPEKSGIDFRFPAPVP